MRRARILTIDGETDVLALNRKHLEPQGYEVACAKTLAEARAAIYEAPPDLVMLDVLMPDGCGYDFCAEVRGITTAPIIYLTCMAARRRPSASCWPGGETTTSPSPTD